MTARASHPPTYFERASDGMHVGLKFAADCPYYIADNVIRKPLQYIAERIVDVFLSKEKRGLSDGSRQ